MTSLKEDEAALRSVSDYRVRMAIIVRKAEKEILSSVIRLLDELFSAFASDDASASLRAIRDGEKDLA